MSAKLLTWKRSPGTRRIYDIDYKIFSTWCDRHSRTPVPCSEETLRLFLCGELEKGFKVSTVERRLAAICYMHDCQHQPVPPLRHIREQMTCARKQRREQKKGKNALEASDLKRICQRLDGKTNASVRDRAILVFGFASGLRRSEIARLDLKDVKVSEKGLAITIAWSKTDQFGEGRVFGIFPGERAATCPVRTMRAWLKARGKEEGPLFTQIQHGCDDVTLERLAGKTIADVVQRAVRRVGLDPADYGAHSLRAGLVTAAAGNGASDREIMRASGHKSAKVMEKYIRPKRVFAERNVLAGVL